ncbi:efflux RND transporter periplasmic adaptor subunit [Bradyrhizobium liaoningense]|uniref:efflux RND transporter periplasmic adaptor subunit n=1 Tax=Bradyrhizobium liaoningense TaxID=43992 RepID=UPI001BAAB036|nr:efflux RND transporter periplasmic adaptor subunit [Bradyrhizobium liaoningense]MBR0854782.1 efflux RND transporter periplasmic adaptor subunit [Bradyrhizobium liaoningense]
MEGFLPEELELKGTVESNVGAQSDRLAPAEGVIVDLFISPGSFASRGTAVLTITGEVYIAAQREFINAFTEAAAAAELSDVAGALRAKEAALAALKLARSQIDQIRTNRRVIDPLPVLCPADAIVTNAISPRVSFAAGAALFSFTTEHTIRCWMNSEHAAYLRPSKQATVIFPDGRQIKASLDSLGASGSNGAREVWLKADKFVAAGGQPVQVKFQFQPFERVTPSCTSSEWGYPILPRGSDLRRLRELHAQKTGAVLAPVTPPPLPKIKPTSPAVVSFLSGRPQRAPARYHDPALSSAPASKRHSLFLDPTEFERLSISTSRATRTTIVPHWRCSAQVLEDAPPEQPFHVTAPYTGHFVPASLRRSDTVNAGQLIGTLRLSDEMIAAQRVLLRGAESSGHERAKCSLRAMGFVDQDFDAIALGRQPLTELPMIANASGLVLHCNERERSVLAGESLMQLLCINAHLIRASIDAAEYAQLPSPVKADLYRPIQTAPLYSTDTLRVTERSRRGNTIFFDAIFPTDKQKLEPGHVLDLVLSDPSRAISKLFIPRDCIMQIGRSHEVLIHSRGGVFTPAAIKTGKAHGEDVEVVSGLTEGCFVVRDLKPLSHASREIRAIMGGFWEPPQKLSRLTF